MNILINEEQVEVLLREATFKNDLKNLRFKTISKGLKGLVRKGTDGYQFFSSLYDVKKTITSIKKDVEKAHQELLKKKDKIENELKDSKLNRYQKDKIKKTVSKPLGDFIQLTNTLDGILKDIEKEIS